MTATDRDGGWEVPIHPQPPFRWLGRTTTTLLLTVILVQTLLVIVLVYPGRDGMGPTGVRATVAAVLVANGLACPGAADCGAPPRPRVVGTADNHDTGDASLARAVKALAPSHPRLLNASHPAALADWQAAARALYGFPADDGAA